MGYLIALFIGFALGWLASALFMSSSRLKARLTGRQDTHELGVDPIYENYQPMSKA